MRFLRVAPPYSNPSEERLEPSCCPILPHPGQRISKSLNPLTTPFNTIQSSKHHKKTFKEVLILNKTQNPLPMPHHPSPMSTTGSTHIHSTHPSASHTQSSLRLPNLFKHILTHKSLLLIRVSLLHLIGNYLHITYK